jgi:hypothetical protein
MRAFKLIFVRRKIIYLQICGVLNPQKIIGSTNCQLQKYGPQIANPQIATFAEGVTSGVTSNSFVIASVTSYNPTDTVTNGNDVIVTFC